MTQAEKKVLKDIVAELEKLTKAVLKIQDVVPASGQSVTLTRNFDNLRNAVDALPSK